MKNKLFLIILVALFSLPVSVLAVGNAPAEPVTVQEQEFVANSLDEDVEAEATENLDFKQPVSKKQLAKKFLAAMGGVAISSFLLFFMLTLYNRVRENVKNKVKTPEGEISLETPNDLSSAVRTFLDKTNW